jgi:hypothetical protein
MPNKTGIEKKEKGAFSRLLSWVTWVFLAFVVYLLSAGPIQKLAYGGYMGGNPVPSLVVVYAPVIWASDNVPLFNRCFGWYIKLWHIYE